MVHALVVQCIPKLTILTPMTLPDSDTQNITSTWNQIIIKKQQL